MVNRTKPGQPHKSLMYCPITSYQFFKLVKKLLEGAALSDSAGGHFHCVSKTGEKKTKRWHQEIGSRL